jgi:hypothetical protein
MNEIILANLLFQVAAGTSLVLIAALGAARELRRRPVRIPASTTPSFNVLELRSPHVSQRPARIEMEEQSEAA